ncbi:hypothetical protein BDZ91DRAFT_333393 [Kalaharituber pfeilii]|nr:hypothetical protein BDZ91DRAFT_333393 [Kalaharituber pfeilii]
MEYLSPMTQPFSIEPGESPPLTKNQRRLQLRHTLSSKTTPLIGSYDTEDENIILQDRRKRSSSTSSMASSTRSHDISTFDDYEHFAVYSDYNEEDTSKPPTPVDEIMPDASPPRFAGSTSSSMRRVSGKGLRKASFYSEASTLVNDGFGDLMVLSTQSLVGPRFYESGSGSGSENSVSKRERGSPGSITSTGSSKRRATARRSPSMGKRQAYSTPRRRATTKDTSQHHYMDMHPEDIAKYIEHLEAQTQDLTAQLHNLTSPTSSVSNVAKLKKLTSENRSLKMEIEEWQTTFEHKVKEECRSRIIANGMEARARIQAMEQTLEETRETVKMLHADIDKLKMIIEEVEYERNQAEKAKREVELKVGVLTDILRAREGESRCSSRASSSEGGDDARGRYSHGPYAGSVIAALRKGSGAHRGLSISSSQFEGSEDGQRSRRQSNASSCAVEDLRALRFAQMGSNYAESASPLSPTSLPFATDDHTNTIQVVRKMRSFKGDSPQPLVLPVTTGISQPSSPTQAAGGLGSPPQSILGGSRPHSAHSNAPSAFYGAGMLANSSNISIDSGRTPSVRSGISGNPASNSLFAELSRLEDLGDITSVKDDASEYTRFHSRVPSYNSFTRQHHRGPSLITSPIVATPRLRSPIRSPVIRSINDSSTPTPAATPPPQYSSLFSSLTSPSSGPLHLVADTLTRYRLGKVLVAVGHGLKSPRMTLFKVKSKAKEIIVKVLTGDMEVERVSRRRKKIWNQRERVGNDEKNCARCSPNDRGRKRIGKSGKRSVSAPISSRVSGVRLTVGTPVEAMSREPSVARDRSASRCPQHHCKRRVSTTSKACGKLNSQQGPESVRRQRQVHAGDNMWMWFRFLMALVVTIGVAVKQDDDDGIRSEKCRYRNEVAVTDDDASDYMGEIDEDDEDVLEIKIEKWRKQRSPEVGSH